MSAVLHLPMHRIDVLVAVAVASLQLEVHVCVARLVRLDPVVNVAAVMRRSVEFHLAAAAGRPLLRRDGGSFRGHGFVLLVPKVNSARRRAVPTAQAASRPMSSTPAE